MPIDVFMTQLSPTMTEGKIARWLKKEGDTLSSGEVMAEIETDKATMEMEVVDEGILHKIISPEGAVVAVGNPIAVIAEEGEDVPDDYVPKGATKVVKPSAKAEEPPTAITKPASQSAPPIKQSNPSPPPQSSPTNETRRVKASPLARRLAKQKGINLAAIAGSGPNGRITRADIDKAGRLGINLGFGTGATTPPPVRPLPSGPLPYHSDEYDVVENSMMRKAIARRLVESKQQVPHFYLTIEAAMDRLMDLRAQLNEGANGAFKLSVNDFIIKAVAKALVDVPAANASWTDAATLRHKHAHISVAVAIEGGLITPVIRFAEQKGLVEISNEVKELAGRARQGGLKPEEYTGGTFSISNLGMYGIKHFSAIINPPEGAILAVGATEARPVVVNGQVQIRQELTLTLSCDHRVVDGAVGAEFLASMKKYLEAPASVLI